MKIDINVKNLLYDYRESRLYIHRMANLVQCGNRKQVINSEWTLRFSSFRPAHVSFVAVYCLFSILDLEQILHLVKI